MLLKRYGDRFEKSKEIRILREMGWTYARIGDLLGVSRQRVQQLCPRSSPAFGKGKKATR